MMDGEKANFFAFWNTYLNGNQKGTAVVDALRIENQTVGGKFALI